MENIKSKNLEINDKITFFDNNTLMDGQIIEKNYLDKGDIDFVIKTSDNRIMRSKHRNLNIYCKY